MAHKLIMLSEPILVSDEEIKIGDYKYHHVTGIIKAIVDGNYTNQFKIIAGITELPSIDFSLLSEEDCQEIGFIDVEKLADRYADVSSIGHDTSYHNLFNHIYEAYLNGFKTAQSLNDKMFSLDDVQKAIVQGSLNWQDRKEQTIGGILAEIIQSLQQVKVFDVEVEMEDVCNNCGDVNCIHAICKSQIAKIKGISLRPKITNNQITVTKVL